MTYILDTNIITAILKKNKENEKVKKTVQKAMLEGKKIFITGINYYETKRGLLAINATAQLKKFELLCREFDLVFLDSQDIFDKAAEIYVNLKQERKILEDADILIASVVSSKDFVLVSHDKHFNRIQGLQIEDWLN